MAFTAKYGNGDEIGTDDECAKALRDAGFKSAQAQGGWERLVQRVFGTEFWEVEQCKLCDGTEGIWELSALVTRGSSTLGRQTMTTSPTVLLHQADRLLSAYSWP
eukprot:m.127947 g.127947  ORF g.127947 m.127947 type:complete len:105 (-) comp9740_c1_seq1:2139-2453(-)